MAIASHMLPALLMLIAFAAAGAVEMTALDKVCGNLGGFYVTPELCASVLCADPSLPCRAARDAPAVVTLAARLAAQNATATKASIEAALSSSRAGNATSAGADVVKGIQSCLQLYAGAVPALQWATRSVAAGRYRGAREVLQAVQYGTEGCEGMAGDAAAVSKENSGFTYMAMVAHAAVASMVRDY